MGRSASRCRASTSCVVRGGEGGLAGRQGGRVVFLPFSRLLNLPRRAPGLHRPSSAPKMANARRRLREREEEWIPCRGVEGWAVPPVLPAPSSARGLVERRPPPWGLLSLDEAASCPSLASERLPRGGINAGGALKLHGQRRCFVEFNHEPGDADARIPSRRGDEKEVLKVLARWLGRRESQASATGRENADDEVGICFAHAAPGLRIQRLVAAL